MYHICHNCITTTIISYIYRDSDSHFSGNSKKMNQRAWMKPPRSKSTNSLGFPFFHCSTLNSWSPVVLAVEIWASAEEDAPGNTGSCQLSKSPGGTTFKQKKHPNFYPGRGMYISVYISQVINSFSQLIQWHPPTCYGGTARLAKLRRSALGVIGFNPGVRLVRLQKFPKANHRFGC